MGSFLSRGLLRVLLIATFTSPCDKRGVCHHGLVSGGLNQEGEVVQPWGCWRTLWYYYWRVAKKHSHRLQILCRHYGLVVELLGA